jgi:hypothetical protein
MENLLARQQETWMGLQGELIGGRDQMTLGRTGRLGWKDWEEAVGGLNGTPLTLTCSLPCPYVE